MQMSTSAAIGVVQADGTIKATFLMHDGSGVSAATILPGWYNSQEKADALLALGPLYKLGTKIAPIQTRTTVLKNRSPMWFSPSYGIEIASDKTNLVHTTFSRTGKISQKKLQQKCV